MHNGGQWSTRQGARDRSDHCCVVQIRRSVPSIFLLFAHYMELLSLYIRVSSYRITLGLLLLRLSSSFLICCKRDYSRDITWRRERKKRRIKKKWSIAKKEWSIKNGASSNNILSLRIHVYVILWSFFFLFYPVDRDWQIIRILSIF